MPNKHKLYEKNLGFGIYLGRGTKKVKIKIIIYNFKKFKNILNIGRSGRIRQVCKSHDPNPIRPTIKKNS